MTYTLHTKLGTLDITPTDADHIYAQTRQDSVLCFRGVLYRGSFHLYRWPADNGRFHIGQPDKTRHEQRTSTYLHRAEGPYPRKEPSKSALEGIQEAITEAVNRWIMHNNDMMFEAQLKHLGDVADKAERECVEAQQLADQARQTAYAARQQWREFREALSLKR